MLRSQARSRFGVTENYPFTFYNTGWLFIIDPFKEMLTGFYPLDAPNLEGGPLRRFYVCLFFPHFILLAPAHTVSLQPLQPVLYYIDPSFSLSFCLDPHVFNVNVTKNHDPFLLIRLSFSIFWSLSRPFFFFSFFFSRYGISADTFKFLSALAGNSPFELFFLFPCTTMTSPALAGEYGYILTWVAGPVFRGSLAI